MASNDCSLLTFYQATKTAFYFEEAGIDLDEDSFNRSVYPMSENFIRSKDNKFLILNDDEQFRAQNLTTQQQHQPGNKFTVQFYNENLNRGKKGRAVMLYANKDGREMVVCCNDNHEIHPVEMDLPQHIPESANKAVFYRTEVCTSFYSLESSWFPSEFLGFEPDVDNHTLSKLVLHSKGEDEVDESMEVGFFKCTG